MKKSTKSEQQLKILRAEKRILLLGVGTFKNPIKLVAENKPRKLLEDLSINLVNDKTELHKLKQDHEGEVFLTNIFTNPYLTKDEIRILLYFYRELYLGGEIFLTIESDKEFDYEINYGEKGVLYVGRPNSQRHQVFKLNGTVINLLDELETVKISFSSRKLIAALKRLDDFGYITITEINLANTYEGHKIHNRGKSRARLRHIRLSEEMQKKNLTNRWVRKKKKRKKLK